MTERIMENGCKEVNQNFYRKLLIVGIPMIIQQVIAVTLNLADTIMVGKVGENALAAVGAANQIYFIFGVVLFGVFSGAAVHAVQYWGIRDIVSLRKIIGIDYTVCLALAVPVTVFVFLTAPGLIRLFAEDAEVVLLNPEGSPCYFTFELVLTDTDEVLYISMQVELGQMITNITRNRALPAGQYNAELRITTASLQDGSAMNGANVVTVPDVQ